MIVDSSNKCTSIDKKFRSNNTLPVRPKYIVGALAVMFGLIPQTQVLAQQGASMLEEIVVTAQKRSESLQEVPIAINAVAGDQLEAMGVSDTDDIVNLYPNLQLQGASTLNTGFSIRGVGTNNYHITGQQAVGQYTDEITLVSPFTSTLAVFDMERVEILRGPQNTLFGRNTTGGAVNFITRKPEIGGVANGYTKLRVGNEGRLDFEGAFGFSMGNTAAARIAVSSANRDPIFENLYVDPGSGERGDDLGAIERNSARVHVAWEPSDLTSVLFSAHVGYNRGDRGVRERESGIWAAGGPNNVTTNQGVMTYTAAQTAGATILAPIPNCTELNSGISMFEGVNGCQTLIPRTGGTTGDPSTSDWNQTYDAGNQAGDVDYEGVFVNVAHSFDSFDFTSITSFDQISVDFLSQNASFPWGIGFMPGQSGEWDIWSQEFRFVSSSDGPYRWITGAFYSGEDDRLATIINRTDDGAPPFGVVPSVSIDQDVDIWSVYGQMELDVSDSGTLTLGIRYTDDSKTGVSQVRVAAFTATGTPGARLPLNTYLSLEDYDQLTATPSGICPPNVGGFPCETLIPVEQSLKETGFRLGYDHQFSDDVMGYASISKGFKSGAFDTRALAAFSGTADRPVEPESLYAYEVGFKSDLADNALQLNGSLFYYDWEDLQVFDVDQGGAPAFLNVPGTEILGAEIEARWAPGNDWYIQAGLGLLDTEITDDGGLTTVENGSPLQNSPEFSLTGLIQKDIFLGNNLLTLQTDFAYRDEYNSSLDDTPYSVVDETLFWNARVSYIFGANQMFELALWAENITEEKTCASIGTLGTLTYSMACSNPNAGMAFYGLTFGVDF